MCLFSSVGPNARLRSSVTDSSPIWLYKPVVDPQMNFDYR